MTDKNAAGSKAVTAPTGRAALVIDEIKQIQRFVAGLAGLAQLKLGQLLTELRAEFNRGADFYALCEVELGLSELTVNDQLSRWRNTQKLARQPALEHLSATNPQQALTLVSALSEGGVTDLNDFDPQDIQRLLELPPPRIKQDVKRLLLRMNEPDAPPDRDAAVPDESASEGEGEGDWTRQAVEAVKHTRAVLDRMSNEIPTIIRPQGLLGWSLVPPHKLHGIVKQIDHIQGQLDQMSAQIAADTNQDN